MPTTADLQRLQAMLAALTPLASEASGEVIRAQDWNALAGAVAELAQVVIAGGPDVSPPHDHAGAVGLSWLDPGLRAQVQGGTLGDPAQDARLGAVERALSRLDERITGLGNLVSDLQTAAGQSAANDLVHRGQFAAINATVSGLSDARTDVANLRGSLATLQTSVSAAVQASAGLQVDGQPIGTVVTALTDRVSAVEGTQRQNTATLAQVATATTDVVTNARLQAAVSSVQATLSQADRDALRQGIESDVQQSINTTVTSATQQLQASFTQQLVGIDGKVSTAVTAATAELSTQIVAQVQPQIAAAVAQSQASVLSTVGSQIGAAVTQAQNAVESDLATLRSSVPGIVGQEVTRQVGGALSAANSHLSTLDQQVSGIGQRVTANDGAIAALNQRVTQIPLDEAGSRQALQAQLEQEIGQGRQDSASALANGLAGLRTDLQAQVSGSIQALSSSVQAEIGTVNTSVTSQVQQAADALRSQMATVADQRIDAARPVLIQQVNTHVGNVLSGRTVIQ